MVKFQEETLADVMGEVQPLLVDHWREVALFKDKVELAPDYERYENAERSGMLHIVTARDEGTLVGYCVTFVLPHLHYKHCLMGMNDILYIKPEYRRGSLGARIVAFAEAALAGKGVEVVTFHVKLFLDFSPMLERKGYEWQEKIMIKYIGGQG